jgi:hypothetical protein
LVELKVDLTAESKAALTVELSADELVAKMVALLELSRVYSTAFLSAAM